MSWERGESETRYERQLLRHPSRPGAMRYYFCKCSGRKPRRPLGIDLRWDCGRAHPAAASSSPATSAELSPSIRSAGGGGGGTVGSPDETNPVCAFALGLVIGLKFQDEDAEDEYQAAYNAYVLKHAEYTAWDNQAKADGVYTWPEQAKLNELGDQLRSLESKMNAAKESYDKVHKALIAAEILVGGSCLFT